MKNKKITAILSSTLALTLLLTGCGNENKTVLPENSVTSGGTVKNYGAAVSVADIKKAHEASENSDVMPLYNVAPDETFEFKFKSNWLDADANLNPSDLVTIHTDPACTEDSLVYTSNLFDEDDPYKLKVSPIGGVLTTDSEDHEMIENKTEVWGNASMYYIALWCDLDKEDEDCFKKLDKPTVIPFTVKHELAIPTVKGVVDATGRFKLVWDAVEGATGYNIYWYGNVSPESHSTGEKNIPVPGAEKAYDIHSDCSLIKTDEATEPEFDNFSGKDHGLGIHYHNDLDDDDTDFIFGQNYNVNGSYFVTAVFGDKESGLSNIVNTSDLILPFEVVEEQDPMMKMFDDESELPRTVDVLNIDGSKTKHNVNYKFHWGKTLEGNDYPKFRFSVEGTAITGECSMNVAAKDPEYYNDYKEGDLPRGSSDKNSSGTSTKAEPDNKTPFNPDKDIDTIIGEDPVPDDGGESSEPESEPQSKPESDPESKPTLDPGGSDKTLVERQIENTEKHIEKGDNDNIENTDLTIFADSAEEEWIARNLIAGNESISLEAFPSVQQYDTLMDVFQKVYYQNPYVLGVTAYKYDYGTLSLNVNYCYDKDEIEKKQSEIKNAAEKIVGETVKNSMSAEEKCRAIYDYFNDNTAYDDAAVEAAEASDYTKNADWKEHEDAFNAHGIIVDKKGVCQSYALSYKLLCSMCEVESKVITGYLDGNLPHAWSAVKLDGEWYQTDCTNNAANCGIPFFLYEAGEDDLAVTGYTEDKFYELDTLCGTFAVENSDKEYYEANGLTAGSIEEYETVLGKCLGENPPQVIAIRYTAADLTQEDIVKAVNKVYNMKGLEEKLPTLGLGYSNGFIVLIEKREIQ